MKIGLIDVDGHNFPNLPLMKISRFHKDKGDQVNWYDALSGHYDKVYMSKVFSFTPDYLYEIDADEVVKGGTGYAIKLENDKEKYYKELDPNLPKEIEKCKPDYSIYPQFDFAVSLTTRGCPRGCDFCHIAAKEGRCSIKVANVSDYYDGQKHIEILDPNITACRDRFELYEQYMDTGATLNFNQGLDMRLITDRDIDYYNKMKIKDMHFAWDNPKDDLKDKFEYFAKKYRYSYKGQVYVLTNFNSTMEENLYRIYTLFGMGFYPYVMIYDKEHCPKEIKDLQRWCNNRIIFKSCKFEDYKKENVVKGQINLFKD